MNFFESIKKTSKSAPLWIAAFWALILPANFIPIIPQPSVIIGYLWKVEFVFALFLLSVLFAGIKYLKSETSIFNFSKQEFYILILPVILFTLWSGISAFWADSPRNAVHHTLLWACYGIFYLLARTVVKDARLMEISLKVTGTVIFVLGVICLTEFFSSEIIDEIFTFRYYKYAEALSVLLPIYAALVLRRKSRSTFILGITVTICWTIIVISLSRTAFLSSLAGISVFFALTIFLSGKNDLRKKSGKSGFGLSLKKSLLFIGMLISVILLSQITIYDKSEESTTITRLMGDNEAENTIQSRYLDWGIGFEMFKMNPAVGIGADNFVTSYRTAHEKFSQENPNSELVKLDETILPERAHNEYLQILAELGIVGSLFFIWFLFGIGSLLLEIFRQKKVSMISIGAFAGLAAFLVSSLASSYSFRVPANGVCFFFVLALAVEGLFKDKEKFAFDFAKIKPVFAYGSLAICFSMLIFSGVRGASLMYLKMSSDDSQNEEKYLQTAHALDENDAMINYYYGFWLHKKDRSDEAVSYLRKAIDKGFATSISYHDLYTAQLTARRDLEAEQTLEEALRVFPKSVFLLTAYAAHLQKTDNFVKSNIELAKALEVKHSQAESWWIVQTEGTAKLNKKNEDGNLVEVMELLPKGAIYSVLDFQRRNNPQLVKR